MYYHLLSNQADRISFDEMVARLASEALTTVPEEIGAIKQSPRTYVEATWGAGEEFIDTDDLAEAKARFVAVFLDVISAA